ncbi:lipocalin family protein [Fibrella sp. ES10-3-2-2]|nr:hypothetical protein A6C57_22945 [Fibrella sp. ES10-3-2-2]
MKLTLLPLLFLMMACSKQDNVPANTLVGTWRLVSYCNPVSPTDCTPTTVPSGKGVFVTFTSDGTFTETYENSKYEGYGFLGCQGGYSIEKDDVRIITGCMSSTGGKLVRLVSVDASQLVLNPNGTGNYVFTR